MKLLEKGDAPLAPRARTEAIAQLRSNDGLFTIHEMNELAQRDPLAEADVVIRFHCDQAPTVLIGQDEVAPVESGPLPRWVSRGQ